MNVREYTDEDFEHIKALHARSGFGYALPDLSSASVFSRRVVGDDTGIAMAAFLQRTAEAFLICDGEWKTPAWRFDAVQLLHRACFDDARRNGIANVNAFIVPEIKKTFGSRLKRIGWKYYEDGKEWHCYTFPIEAAQRG